MQELWNSLIRFCNYQERCKADVVKKMTSLGVKPSDFASWIRKLEEEKLLNESRFIKNFIHGRFKNKKWGKQKIANALSAKGISKEKFDSELNALIEDESYCVQLKAIAQKKATTIRAKNMLDKKQKLIRFLLGKGYAFQEVANVVNEILTTHHEQ